MKLTIHAKIMIGFSVVMVIMIAANAYVLYQLGAVKKATDVTLTTNVRAIDLARQLQAILFEEERNVRKYFASLDSVYSVLYAEQTTRFEPRIDSLLNLEPYGAGRSLLRKIRDDHRGLVTAIRNDIDTARQSMRSAPTIYESGGADSLKGLQNAIGQYIRTNEISINTAFAKVAAAMERSSDVAYFLTIGALTVALAVAFFVARTITRPIDFLIAGTDSIARGSVEPIPVSSRDEISLLTRAVNDMSSRLKEINDLKTELMHHASHELRAPLQAMRSANDFLAEQRFGVLNQQQLRLLAFIREGIARITKLSNQLLDFVAIESGTIEYRLVHANLIPIVAQEVNEAKLAAYRKNISISFHAGIVPHTRVDVEKVGQVVSNLLTNATKFTGEGGMIEVSVLPSELGVKIRVKDSGAGIAPEELQKVFTRFYQARNIDTANGAGTGIGLTLVKALTEGQGGRVSVESTLGVGTTFTVEFPAAPGEGSGDDVQAPLTGAEA